MLEKKNPSELKSINFDTDLLDIAASSAKDLADLPATTMADDVLSSAKKIRDKAFTLLKRRVDRVYRFGQFVFWQDASRRRGYASEYLRNHRKKRVKSAG